MYVCMYVFMYVCMYVRLPYDNDEHFLLQVWILTLKTQGFSLPDPLVLHEVKVKVIPQQAEVAPGGSG